MRDPFAPLRARLERRESARSRRLVGRGGVGQPTFVGRVVASPKFPTATGRYYSVNPVSFLGREGEGLPGSPTVDPTTVVRVALIGTTAPAVGDDLICRSVGDRWVAERRGKGSGTPTGGGVALAGCSCGTVPPTLHLSISGTCLAGDFEPCTLSYGPTPAEFAPLNLGASCFLSAETFTDAYTGQPYRVFFGCDASQFRISRVYLPHDQQGPYRDATSYTWAIGLAGNSCSPLLLAAGTIYPGGNPRCKVTISE